MKTKESKMKKSKHIELVETQGIQEMQEPHDRKKTDCKIQSNNDFSNRYFNFAALRSCPSKHRSFHSLQRQHMRHNGTACHIHPLPLLLKHSFQHTNISCTYFGIAQETSNRKNIIDHSS